MFIIIVSYIIHKPYLIHLNNAVGIILCTCDITQDLMTRVPLGLGALEFSTLLLSCVRCCVWNFDSAQIFLIFLVYGTLILHRILKFSAHNVFVYCFIL